MSKAEEKNRISGRLPWQILLLLALITAVVAAYSPLAPWSKSAITTDQAVFLTIARGITRGKLAYVDYFDHKGILLYLLLAAGLKLGAVLPGTLTGCWLIEIVFIFASIALSYRLSAMYASRYIAVIPAAVTMLLHVRFFTTSNSEEYMYPLLLLAVWLFMLQIRKTVMDHRMFLMGLTGMAVFFIKYNYCLIWAILGIILVIYMTICRLPFRNILRKCLLFLLGMLTASVLPGLYLLCTGSMRDFMDAYVLYSVHYAGYTSVADRLDSILFLIWTPMEWYNIGFLILCVVILIVRVAVRRDALLMVGTLNLKECFCWLMVMAAVVVTAASPGQKWIYYRQATYVIYIVPIALISQMLYQLMSKRLPVVLAGAVIAALAFWTIRSGFAGGDWTISHSKRQESTEEAATYIKTHTNAQERVIAFSNDCSVYFYSGREPDSRILFPSAAIVDEALLNELLQDLTEDPPAYMTFQKDWKNGLPQSMISRITQLRDSGYTLVYQDAYRSVYAPQKD